MGQGNRWDQGTSASQEAPDETGADDPCPPSGGSTVDVNGDPEINDGREGRTIFAGSEPQYELYFPRILPDGPVHLDVVDPCPGGGDECPGGCGACIEAPVGEAEGGAPTPTWSLMVHAPGTSNPASSPHTTIGYKAAEGVFYHFPHDAGVAPTSFERRYVDGTVEKFEHVHTFGNGDRRFRPTERIDPYDNRTVWEYNGPDGRVSRVFFPDGVDQVWDYSPSWIDDPNTQDVEGWSSVYYAGIEVRYVDRLNGDQDLGRTEYRLFKKRTDAQGNLVGNTRPYDGDPLYRIYRPSAESLDSLSATQLLDGTLYDVATDDARYPVVEFEHLSGESYITKISRFTADGVLPTSSTTTPQEIVSYTYVTVGARMRVLKETQALTGRQYDFVYEVDVDSNNRVQRVIRTDHDGVEVDWTLDDYNRVLTIKTTPPSSKLPRASDPDSGGFDAPANMTRTFTYSGCSQCSGKPSTIEDQPSGRRWEYDYDLVTGLLEESRVPDPSDGVGFAVTKFTWVPSTSGDFYGQYRLSSVESADNKITTYAYVDTARVDASWGVKASEMTVSSPPTTIGGTTGTVVIERETKFNTSSPPLDQTNQQEGLVGQVSEETDADGVTTAFTYDARGRLTTIQRQGATETVTATTAFSLLGELLEMRRRVGSTLQLVENYTYDAAGQLKTKTYTVNGQPHEERFFYDSFGNLVVHQTKNRTHAGLAPNDFGPSPRTDAARDWLRNEWHYEGNRLRVAFLDRRALDRDADTQDPVADDPDARFARVDYTWSADGWLLQVAHANGSVTAHEYDGYGALYRTDRRDGASSVSMLVGKFFVNDDLEVVKEYRSTGSEDLATLLTRNAAGFVEEVLEPEVTAPITGMAVPAFAKREFDWDVMGRLVEERVRDGASPHALRATRSTTYDEIGRPYIRTIVDPGGATQTFTTQWTGGGQPTLTTGPGGRAVERTFDDLGRLKRIYRGGSGANRDFVEFFYAAGTDLVDRTEHNDWDDLKSGGAGHVTRQKVYERDALGRVLTLRDGPTGNSLDHEFEYYSTGFTESYTDPAGKVHKYLPDAMGRIREHSLPATVAAPIWNEVRYLDWTGGSDSSEVVRTDGRGRVTRIIRDFAGRVTVVMNPGASTEPTAASPSQPFSQFFEYDGASRVVGVHQGDDAHLQLDRDGMGRLIVRTVTAGDSDYVSAFYGRDILGRDALGQVVHSYSRFGLNGVAGQYLEQDYERDALGRTHRESFRYEAPPWGPSNWVDIESTFSGGDWFRTGVAYRNNLGSGTDDLELYTAPDSVGRLATLQWSSDGGTTVRSLAAYVHHGWRIRQRTTHWDAGTNDNFDTTYSYDDYGRMDEIEQSFSTGANDADVAFSYDVASNLISEVYQKQDGSDGDRFEYDEHHRLVDAWLGADSTELANPGTGTFVRRLTYGLDAANNRSQVDDYLSSPGTTTTTTYAVDADPPTVSNPDNRYNAVGGVTFTYDERGNTTFDGNLYYVYDALNRLSEVYLLVSDDTTESSSAMSGGSTSLTTMSSLRRLEVASGPFVIQNQQVLADARERMLSGVPGGAGGILWRSREPLFREYLKESIPSQGAWRTSGGSSTTSTSSLGGAESATLHLVAVYQYDPSNRRVARLLMPSPDGEPGQYFFYAWDGWHEAEELTSNLQSTQVVPERQFAWGEQLDELVAYRIRQSGSGFAEYFVAEGGAHCPSRLLDDSGSVVEIQEYGPYGAVWHFSGAGVPRSGSDATVGNVFGWKMMRIDGETGLGYRRNRFYSTSTGRFMSVDPSGIWWDAHGLGNGYVYAGSRPLTHNDRMGLQADPGAQPDFRSLLLDPLRDSLSDAAKREAKDSLLKPIGDRDYGDVRWPDLGRIQTDFSRNLRRALEEAGSDYRCPPFGSDIGGYDDDPYDPWGSKIISGTLAKWLSDYRGDSWRLRGSLYGDLVPGDDYLSGFEMGLGAGVIMGGRAAFGYGEADASWLEGGSWAALGAGLGAAAGGMLGGSGALSGAELELSVTLGGGSFDPLNRGSFNLEVEVGSDIGSFRPGSAEQYIWVGFSMR